MTFRAAQISDRSTFLNTNEFAVSAIFTGNNGTTGAMVASTVVVDFSDDPETVIDMETGGVLTSGPRAIIKTDDIPNVKKGETLEISGTEYKIIEIKHDGDFDKKGLTTLRLSRD